MKYINYFTGYWKSGKGRNGRDFGIFGFGGNIAIVSEEFNVEAPTNDKEVELM